MIQQNSKRCRLQDETQRKSRFQRETHQKIQGQEDRTYNEFSKHCFICSNREFYFVISSIFAYIML